MKRTGANTILLMALPNIYGMHYLMLPLLDLQERPLKAAIEIHKLFSGIM
jgi:hypothetical protein